VTANKALLAAFGEELTELARATGGAIVGSAAVGGAAPLLEAVAHARPAGITQLEGILNGTTNHMLDAQRQGFTFAEALADAQALGFAETDPSADLDGIDAAQKLVLLARAAFGRDPDALDVTGIRGLALPAAEDATIIRLVARAALVNGRVIGTVRPTPLSPDDPLASAAGEWNALTITTGHGERITVRGKGAGRGPTAEAVFADLLDGWRSEARQQAAAREEVLRG
jgi:homoserine dehydrogenase